MAAGEPYRSATRGMRWRVAVVIGIALGALGCGDSSDGEAVPLETSASETTVTGLPSCRDVDLTVVISVFGAATVGAVGEAETWVGDPNAEPEARPDAATLARSYRGAGYQLLYVAMIPSETVIGGRPVVDAITVWLGVHGFPVGEGARVWVPAGDGSADPSVALIEELARIGAGGAEVVAGYAGDQETVFPLVAGGVPHDRVYDIVGASEPPPNGEVSSTPLSEADFAAHVFEVAASDPICE